LCWVALTFLCSAERRFFIPADFWQALRAVAVNTGRRPPRSVARSGVDGREHGAIIDAWG
jgi:hypothetical protein